MPMPPYDAILNAFTTLLVTVDPPGLAPLFLALTAGMNRQERHQVAIRACLISLGVLVLFALAGSSILSVLGITIPAFRVAGGMLLFVIAFEMIFERRQQRHKRSAERAITRDMIHNIAAFPLAIPLTAGPGAISATLLLSGTASAPGARLVMVAILLVVILITYLVFVLAERIDRFLGETGRSILTRLLGLLLSALAVQFVADGARELIQNG